MMRYLVKAQLPSGSGWNGEKSGHFDGVNALDAIAAAWAAGLRGKIMTAHPCPKRNPQRWRPAETGTRSKWR